MQPYTLCCTVSAAAASCCTDVIAACRTGMQLAVSAAGCQGVAAPAGGDAGTVHVEVWVC